jgi:hypothetical protein
MIGLICSYFLIPPRYQFIVRWLAVLFILVVFAMVVILFARTISILPKQHRKVLPSKPTSSRSQQSSPSLSIYVVRIKEAA